MAKNFKQSQGSTLAQTQGNYSEKANPNIQFGFTDDGSKKLVVTPKPYVAKNKELVSFDH
jgi:hypothetical protein